VIPAQELVEHGVATAGAAGADGCVVLVEEDRHADVRFALNTTTTNGVHRARAVNVVVVAGASVSTARRTGVVGTEGVAEMVGAALADARSAPPAEDAFPLVEPSKVTLGRDFGLAPEETDASVLEGVLSSLSGAFSRAEARDAVLAGFAELDLATLYLGSSTGLRLSHVQPTGAVHLVARTADGSGSAWVGAPTITPSLEEMEQEIWRRLDWGKRQIALEAGRYEVILPPSGVGDMMAMLGFYTLGGQDAEDGRTVFSKEGGATRVGERITATPFALYSDPFEAGVECAPFVATQASSSDVSVFDNGLPLGRTEWLRGGVLAHLRYHRAGAAKSGVEMAPYVDNLVLRCDGAGGGSVDDMVARTERGLLLTCLWYIREVDPATLLVTGLTRDGVYVIEDGAVVGAANNFRFNESPVDLLARATEVGTPVRSLGREFGEYLNRTIMPPLRIPDYNMSSVSQAS
jgi:predicted Zn-dependent protease